MRKTKPSLKSTPSSIDTTNIDVRLNQIEYQNQQQSEANRNSNQTNDTEKHRRSTRSASSDCCQPPAAKTTYSDQKMMGICPTYTQRGHHLSSHFDLSSQSFSALSAAAATKSSEESGSASFPNHRTNCYGKPDFKHSAAAHDDVYQANNQVPSSILLNSADDDDEYDESSDSRSKGNDGGNLKKSKSGISTLDNKRRGEERMKKGVRFHANGMELFPGEANNDDIDKEKQKIKHKEKIKYSENGCYGWIVVVSSYSALILSQGMMLTTGSVFQQPWQKTFDASAAYATLPMSLMISVSHVTGPIAAICVKKVHFRISALAGFAFITAGLMMTTFCHDLRAICISMGVVAGFGEGLAYFSAFIIVNQFFKVSVRLNMYPSQRKRALACGMVVSGSGMGTLIFSLLEAKLVEVYAWRNALFIVSALMSLGFIPSVLFSNERIPPWSSYWMQKAAIFDKDLLKSPVFLCICVTRTFTFTGFFINYIFLPQHVLQIGATTEETRAFGLIAIGGVSNITGRIMFGWLADQPSVNTVYMFNGVMVVGGLIVTLTPVYPSSYSFFVCYALVFGFMCACFVATDGPILIEYVGSRRVGASYGLYSVAHSIPPFVGGPTAGALFEVTGNFNLAYYVMGSVIVIGGFSGCLIPILSRWEQRNCPRSVTCSAASLPQIPPHLAVSTPCAVINNMEGPVSVDELLNAIPASHVFTRNRTEKIMSEEVQSDQIRLQSSTDGLPGSAGSSSAGIKKTGKPFGVRSSLPFIFGHLDMID